jgi:quercetin dioxygenase-like cupin family protein
MEHWDLRSGPARPHRPEILSSTEEGRVIVLDLPAGEILQDHQVHEAAWLTVIDGEVRLTDHDGQAIDAHPGVLARFSPQERHQVDAVTDSRLLLILVPWPGPGHPGTMTLEQKTDVRDRAAERAS